jgi:hypothetical protein
VPVSEYLFFRISRRRQYVGLRIDAASVQLKGISWGCAKAAAPADLSTMASTALRFAIPIAAKAAPSSVGLVAVSREPPKRSEGSAPGDFPVVEFFGLTGCWNSLDSAVAGDQGLPRRRPPTRHLRPEHQTTLRAGVQARLANMSEAMPEVSNACGGLSAVRFLLRYRLDRGGDPSGG